MPKKFGDEGYQEELIRNEEIKKKNLHLWDEACILSIQKEIILTKIAEARIQEIEEKRPKS